MAAYPKEEDHLFKQMQQAAAEGDTAPQAPAQPAPCWLRRRSVKSTAAILAQGVTLSQVQQAVKRLRPLVERGD